MKKFKAKTNNRSKGQSLLTFITIAILVMMAASTVIAEDAGQTGPDQKSLRYYKVLLRRPESVTAFARPRFAR